MLKHDTLAWLAHYLLIFTLLNFSILIIFFFYDALVIKFVVVYLNTINKQCGMSLSSMIHRDN